VARAVGPINQGGTGVVDTLLNCYENPLKQILVYANSPVRRATSNGPTMEFPPLLEFLVKSIQKERSQAHKCHIRWWGRRNLGEPPADATCTTTNELAPSSTGVLFPPLLSSPHEISKTNLLTQKK
jgi:hypothetical protein